MSRSLFIVLTETKEADCAASEKTPNYKCSQACVLSLQCRVDLQRSEAERRKKSSHSLVDQQVTASSFLAMDQSCKPLPPVWEEEKANRNLLMLLEWARKGCPDGERASGSWLSGREKESLYQCE